MKMTNFCPHIFVNSDCNFNQEDSLWSTAATHISLNKFVIASDYLFFKSALCINPTNVEMMLRQPFRLKPVISASLYLFCVQYASDGMVLKWTKHFK